jgi:hypothetical protein
MQVSILLNPSDLVERLREGMAMSTSEFVSSTLLRICDPDPSSYGSDFSNICVVMKSLPSAACTYGRLIANSPDNDCFCLLVGVVENWIHDMLEIFPITSVVVPNAHRNLRGGRRQGCVPLPTSSLRDRLLRSVSSRGCF